MTTLIGLWSKTAATLAGCYIYNSADGSVFVTDVVECHELQAALAGPFPDLISVGKVGDRLAEWSAIGKFLHIDREGSNTVNVVIPPVKEDVPDSARDEKMLGLFRTGHKPRPLYDTSKLFGLMPECISWIGQIDHWREAVKNLSMTDKLQAQKIAVGWGLGVEPNVAEVWHATQHWSNRCTETLYIVLSILDAKRKEGALDTARMIEQMLAATILDLFRCRRGWVSAETRE